MLKQIKKGTFLFCMVGCNFCSSLLLLLLLRPRLWKQRASVGSEEINYCTTLNKQSSEFGRNGL